MCPARREDRTPLQHYLLLLRAQVMVEQCPDATTDRGRPSPSSIPNTGLWNVWASITSLYSRYQPTLTLPRSQGLERQELPNVLKGLCDSIWSFVLCLMSNMLCPPQGRRIQALFACTFTVLSYAKYSWLKGSIQEKLWYSLPPSLPSLFFLIAFEILILLSFIYQENSASDLRMDILALRRQHTSKTQSACTPFTALAAFIFDCIYATEMPDSSENDCLITDSCSCIAN